MTCQHKNILSMDFMPGWLGLGAKVKTHANRVCVDCRQHWHGPMDSIKEYTRAEWDAWLVGDDANTSPERVQTALDF